MAREVPRRLPKDFIWSSSGQRDVNYTNDESFEGDVGTYLDDHDLGHGGQATVSGVIVKGKSIARKRISATGIDERSRREARMLKKIVHRH
ncbi:hypothetical protein E8E11_004399 [Didymella keratinophila]|nr:hypothetical protein E8E11_004399 [Didymella keratinophila]